MSSQLPPAKDLQTLYDAYFASRDYESRYPEPNEGTLAFLRRHGAMHAVEALDVGCGNGRYAVPWLQEAAGRLTGCDISNAALQDFWQKIQHVPAFASRVQLVHGGVEAVQPRVPFEVILLLFGVLSHLYPRKKRQDLLCRLRKMAAPHCRLFLSVPNIWRRRPLEFLAALVSNRTRESVRDIHFSRWIAGQKRTFYYHLYSVSELRSELAETGWRLVVAEAESVFPEWWITHYAGLNSFDHRLQARCPVSLGYGIRALAQPMKSDSSCFSKG